MTQEHKDLLLKDLCARLPYGVKVQIDLQSYNIPVIICKVVNIECAETGSTFIGVETSPDTYNEFREFLCKPYLFPLSSMTEEQKTEFDTRSLELQLKVIDEEIMYEEATEFEVDFYNKHHLDWRGLIPMGLAIDATRLNIY